MESNSASIKRKRKVEFLKERKALEDEITSEPRESVVTRPWPIVYRPEYNVHFFRLEKLHPFDAKKWKHIFNYLVEAKLITRDNIIEPQEVAYEQLLLAHTERYLSSLKWSFNVAAISEVCPLVAVPNYFVQKCYLKPMRYHVGGTLEAGFLALRRGWSINIGGGFHHASESKGGGFCAYADISLLVKLLFQSKSISTAMIVDLDAHQGNGYEKDFINETRIFIMDVYNKRIYPRDEKAKEAIRCRIELAPYTEDNHYLEKIEAGLERSLRSFCPDIMIYNAGTDVLLNDPLGLLAISPQGIIRRDELVFMKARERRVPIVMLTSGGYLKQTARIIADSILNLADLGLISR